MEKQFDLHNYSDIIDLPHHTSTSHRRMSNVERGAQFSPFSALTGYGAAVDEAGRLTDRRRELSEEVKARLDAKLQILSERIDESHIVTVVYFSPDERKAGGEYVSCTGTVKSIDPLTKRLVMRDRTAIDIEQIRSIEGDLFHNMDLEI